MFTKILVGTDTSAAADIAVETAADLARRNDAELLVLHVRSLDGARDVVDPSKRPDPGAYLSAMSARFSPVRVETRSQDGDPAAVIVDVAETEGADAIVLGNRGTHGNWWRVRDSVPNIVLRHSPCSVFIVDTRRAQ